VAAGDVFAVVFLGKLKLPHRHRHPVFEAGAPCIFFPGKSGVSGGILAVVPGRMGIGVFSPTLDAKGNSLAGMKALELLSERLNLRGYR